MCSYKRNHAGTMNPPNPLRTMTSSTLLSSDPYLLTHSHNTMTKKSFYISMLDQFAKNGKELLKVCDQIISGEIEYFAKPTALVQVGRSDEIDF